jgi:hypothetical protein
MVALLSVALLAALVVAPMDAQAGPKASGVWRAVAKNVRTSVISEAKGSYFLARARAYGLDPEERKEALAEAKEEYKDEKALAKEQYKARLELAAELGETELFEVDIDPADFVTVIDNPYMPLTPGTVRTYRAETDEGTETIVVEVLTETKEILGVTCVVVRDTVSLDGELVEDTRDWFAQDKDGNVWYMGEIALNYEDGELTDVEGSWLAGVDGAQPGIVMPAAPAVGDVYRQEFYLGEAEDYAEVLALDASVSVPFGDFDECLRTFDGTPMEPDVEENKFYAKGVGVVLEADVETGERVELISVTFK